MPLLDGNNFDHDANVDFSPEDEINDSRSQNDSVVGGQRTTIQTHPYIISFRIDRKHVCGGALLTPSAGLTAVHCLAPAAQETYRMTIMVGSTIRTGDENSQFRELSRYWKHSNYSMPTYRQNNLVALFWMKPLQLGPTVRPIALPPKGSAVPYERPCIVTGWGDANADFPDDDFLKSATIPLISNEECNRPRSYNGRITRNELCAGLAEGGSSSCELDM